MDDDDRYGPPKRARGFASDEDEVVVLTRSRAGEEVNDEREG